MKEISITIKEKKRHITHPPTKGPKRPCAWCNGSGNEPWSPGRLCSVCGGRCFTHKLPCRVCGGSGRDVYRRKCKACGGWG